LFELSWRVEFVGRVGELHHDVWTEEALNSIDRSGDSMCRDPSR
jgi:hypothetical protein